MPIPCSLLAQVAAAAAPVWTLDERVTAIVNPTVGLAIAYVVYRVVQRVAWARLARSRLVLLHLAIALAAITSWILLAAAIQMLVVPGGFRAPYWESRVLLGGVAYAIVAGIAHAVASSARAARAEALAARTQLAALRSQLHPHFLFNALHTVVQLIPVEPARAAGAAELLAGLLRTAIAEDRDEVTLEEEWAFVSRYLEVERIRFGDRLVVRAAMDDAPLEARVPAFALQTLVENAVRHGAAERVEPTTVEIVARREGSALAIEVRNAVGGATAVASGGTGLSRLADRLAVLYGGAARLAAGPSGAGYEARLAIPLAGTRP